MEEQPSFLDHDELQNHRSTRITHPPTANSQQSYSPPSRPHGGSYTAAGFFPVRVRPSFCSAPCSCLFPLHQTTPPSGRDPAAGSFLERVCDGRRADSSGPQRAVRPRAGQHLEHRGPNLPRLVRQRLGQLCDGLPGAHASGPILCSRVRPPQVNPHAVWQG